MRVYRGDVMRSVNNRGVWALWTVKEGGEMPWILRMKGTDTLLISKLMERPLRNHLRAAWDSIFRP